MNMNATELFDRLVVEIFRLNGSLLAAGRELVGDLGLSAARWQVLGALELSPVPLPVAHVARNMGLSRQAVQRLVNEMQGEQLLRLAPNPHHRRAQLVLPTEAGRTAYAQAMRRQEPWARALIEGLPASGLATALELLTELRRRLEGTDGDRNQVDQEGETQCA